MPSAESKSPKAAAPTNRSMILSPGFRSAAAMAGWDEEALLFATLVVEDTPVRESRQHKYKKRLKSPASTTSSTRKRRARRQSGVPIPPVVLCLEDEEDGGKNKKIDKEAEKAVVGKAKEGKKEGPLSVEPNKGVPCMDRLREELSCAICLEICFEPSTTPCGHSFCIRCLKCSATKCGKKCPKCRQLISNGRACTINTVLWNTIQLLFPEEVEARKSKATATSPASETRSRSMQYAPHTANTSSNSRRSSTRSSRSRSDDASEASRVITSRSSRTRVGPSQSEDAAMALRLQREEFMVAFQGNSTQGLRRQALNSAHANLRSMVSRRGFYTRTRSSDSDYL